ncbi:hypothetical protein METY_1343 [Methylopila sp. Yamaguchi]|nr:hypothetical protein METY_1343 [Methylopila sp. Yamaguchi]
MADIALEKCPACGHLVSNHASVCIKCGHPFDRTAKVTAPPLAEPASTANKRTRGFLWVAGIFGAIFLIGALAKRPEGPASAPQIAAPAPEASPTPTKSSPAAPIAPAPVAPATPKGTSVIVPSDPRANYWILDARKTGSTVQIRSRREGPSGVSFAKREVDCANGRFRYLSEGDTLADLDKPGAQFPMGLLLEGSISTVISREGCKGVGLTLRGVQR